MLHHVELWVPDLRRAQASWGWLLGALGWEPYQEWGVGRSRRAGLSMAAGTWLCGDRPESIPDTPLGPGYGEGPRLGETRAFLPVERTFGWLGSMGR